MPINGECLRRCAHAFADYNFEAAWDDCRKGHLVGVAPAIPSMCEDFKEKVKSEYLTKIQS